MPQADTLTVDADGNYDITTSDPTFTVTGTVNDNVNGYRLYTNGDNVVHQKNMAGFNNHVDADARPAGTVMGRLTLARRTTCWRAITTSP